MDAADTQGARVVGEHERRDDEVADLDLRDGRSDLLDDTDEFVPDLVGLVDLVDAPIGPEIRTADA